MLTLCLLLLDLYETMMQHFVKIEKMVGGFYDRENLLLLPINTEAAIYT